MRITRSITAHYLDTDPEPTVVFADESTGAEHVIDVADIPELVNGLDPLRKAGEPLVLGGVTIPVAGLPFVAWALGQFTAEAFLSGKATHRAEA